MRPSAVTPLVSVVMPVHNGAAYITEALRSVGAQTQAALEIIVVDDGSTDATAALVGACGDERVRLLTRPVASGLPAVARNQGIAAARGAYVAFLDADDAWVPTRLERQLAAYAAQPAWGLVHCFCQVVDAEGRALYVRRADDMPRDEQCFEALIESCFITTSSVLTSRAVLERVGGFCESPRLRCSEDLEWFLRVAARYPIGFVPEVLVRYRKYAQSVSGADYDLQQRILASGPEVARRVSVWAGGGGAASAGAVQRIGVGVRLAVGPAGGGRAHGPDGGGGPAGLSRPAGCLGARRPRAGGRLATT